MKLIILDRDGVINVDSDEYVKHPDEWHPLPGSLEAIARLSRAGWKVVVASNQSGLARGYFDAAALNAMHLKCRELLRPLGGAIDAFFVCPHGPDDACTCRKPAPGMFKEIARRFDTTLENVPAVGDSLRDLKACAAAGCTPWLVQTGNGLKTRQSNELPLNTRFGKDLSDVVDQILAEDIGA